LSNFDFYQTIRSLQQIEDFLSEHNVPVMTKFINDIRGDSKFDDRILSVDQRKQLRYLLESYQSEEYKLNKTITNKIQSNDDDIVDHNNDDINDIVIIMINEFIRKLENIIRDNSNDVNNIIDDYYQQSLYYQYNKTICKVNKYLESNWNNNTINVSVNRKLLVTSLKFIRSEIPGYSEMIKINNECKNNNNNNNNNNNKIDEDKDEYNFHVIPAICKLIDELTEAKNEHDITTYVHNYYYKIISCQNNHMVIKVRQCLENHGWNWEQFNLLKYSSIQNLISDLKVICLYDEKKLSGVEYCEYNYNQYFTNNNNKSSGKDYVDNKNSLYDIKRVPMKLDSNHPVTKAVVTLFEGLFEGNLESKFTNCIARYCETIDNNNFHGEQIVIELDQVLKKHLWNWDKSKGPRGFYTEPKREILIADIQDVMDNYEIVYTEQKEDISMIVESDIMSKSTARNKLDPDSLLSETINNLVTELYSATDSVNVPVNNYYEMVDLMSYQKEDVVLEINKVLKKYGWIFSLKQFRPTPQCELLVSDIQEVVDKYT
jgi:hypothetical protein